MKPPENVPPFMAGSFTVFTFSGCDFEYAEYFNMIY